MKKTTIIISMALTLGCGGEASAQGWVKSLGERAVERAKSSAQGKVDNLLNLGKQKESTQGASANGSETTSSDDFAGSLWSGGFYDPCDDAQPKQTFTNLAQALQALPAMPSAAQVSSASSKHVADSTLYAPYTAAIRQFLASLVPQGNALAAKMQQSQGQVSQARVQVQRATDAGIMPTQAEIMQALTASGISLENATDEQIKDALATMFSKKWGITKAEYLKIIDLSQKSPKQAEEYIRTSHPTLYQKLYAANLQGVGTASASANDSRNDRFARIFEELAVQVEQLNAIRTASPNVEEMQEQLRGEWVASAEYRQINEIEDALQKRLSQWSESLGSTADVPYPAWFTAERKRENALVDQWNSRAAGKWLDEANARQRNLKAIFDKVAELEAENEQLNKQGTPDGTLYLMNRQSVLSFYGLLVQLLQPYTDAMQFPCLERVEETGTAHMGKG